jgi:hypothetical protein
MAADGYTDPDEPLRSVRGEKVVGETGLLLLAAAACASSEVRERVECVAALLLPHARCERVRARICLEPSLALEHALAHVCLTAIGFPDSDLDRLLSESLQAESAGGRERPPHRQLEQEWMLRVWGSSSRNHHADTALRRRSALGGPSDLLSLHKDDAYAFTHSLMYLTDLGARRVRLPRRQATIAAEADAICASSLDEPDYDLCGEVLLTWPYLRLRWSTSATLAFAVLASVEDGVGFLPAPGTSLERLNTLQGTERSDYIVTSSYHSVFVMGLLSAGALREGCRPPATFSGRGHHTGATAELMPLLGSNDAEPAWREYLDALTPAQQDSAAPFVLNACLRRTALRRDLAGMRSALLVGETHDLLDAPAARQAAELLRRSTTFAARPPSAPRAETP